MKLRQIEKAIKIVEQLKVVDAEIIQIEKMAMLCANGKIKSSFSLAVEDLSEDKVKENILDEDGSLNNPCETDLTGALNRYRFFWMEPCSAKEIKPKNIHSLTSELSDIETLNVLGSILCEKKSKRAQLILQLEKLGVLTNK